MLVSNSAAAQAPAAISGQITSAEEGAMEGVLVTAQRDGASFAVSVSTNERGAYSFAESRLAPGRYSIRIRAVGYELAAPAIADVAPAHTAKLDLTLRKVSDLSVQLTSTEWFMMVMAALPGIPSIPFLLLGGGAAALAYVIDKRQKLQVIEKKKADAVQTVAAAEEPISTALKIDDLKIELGYALLPLVNGPDGTDRLTEQIKALRRSLAIEMGFVMVRRYALASARKQAPAAALHIGG